jgi:hypothetical protein
MLLRSSSMSSFLLSDSLSLPLDAGRWLDRLQLVSTAETSPHRLKPYHAEILAPPLTIQGASTCKLHLSEGVGVR